eukprot:4285147-Amphidinium_carterae.1
MTHVLPWGSAHVQLCCHRMTSSEQHRPLQTCEYRQEASTTDLLGPSVAILEGSFGGAYMDLPAQYQARHDVPPHSPVPASGAYKAESEPMKDSQDPSPLNVWFERSLAGDMHTYPDVEGCLLGHAALLDSTKHATVRVSAQVTTCQHLLISACKEVTTGTIEALLAENKSLRQRVAELEAPRKIRRRR